MICHSGRFYSLAQFAVYTASLAPAQGEPAPTVFGFTGQMLVLDPQPLLENYGDLVIFAKENRRDHHGALDWNVYTDEPIAIASEVTFPAAMGPRVSEGFVSKPTRHFDPRATERHIGQRCEAGGEQPSKSSPDAFAVAPLITGKESSRSRSATTFATFVALLAVAV
jgi:hypothetical protein